MERTLAWCWRTATHYELDGVPASASAVRADRLHTAAAGGHLPDILLQLTDTNLRVALFCDQAVELDQDGAVILSEFPASAGRQARVRFLLAKPLRTPKISPTDLDEPESRLPAFT